MRGLDLRHVDIDAEAGSLGHVDRATDDFDGTSAITTANCELGAGIPVGAVSIEGPTLCTNSARVQEITS